MTDIGLKRYRLLFFGQTLPDTDTAAARRALAKRYRLDDSKLEVCFSGRRVALHRDLDEHSAYRIQAELKRAGLVTQLEALSPQAAAPTPAPSAPGAAGQASPQPTPAPPTQAMVRCPSCQRQIRANALRCQFCGREMRALSTRARLKTLIRPVLAIAILALIGLALSPFYHRYKVQQRVDSGIDRARQVEATVTQFISRTGFWPNSNRDARLSTPESYATEVVATLRLERKARLTLTFQPELSDIGGQTLIFAASQNADGTISWSCVGGSLAARWRPSSCPASADTP